MYAITGLLRLAIYFIPLPSLHNFTCGDIISIIYDFTWISSLSYDFTCGYIMSIIYDFTCGYIMSIMTLPVETAASPRVEVAVVHGPRRVIPATRKGVRYERVHIVVSNGVTPYFRETTELISELYLYLHMYTYVRIYMYQCISIYIIYKCKYVCMYVCMYIYIHIYMIMSCVMVVLACDDSIYIHLYQSIYLYILHLSIMSVCRTCVWRWAVRTRPPPPAHSCSGHSTPTHIIQ
jgi:nuclear pore complex protein Nup62